MTKTITAIIPCRKGHKTIVAAVRSILSQTLAPIEIIIVSEHDMGDESDKAHADLISKGLSEAFPEECAPGGRIRIAQGPRKGPGIARNHGVSLASGELIAFLDDDDIWDDSEKLARQEAYMADHPGIDAVGTETAFFIRESAEAAGYQRFKTIAQPTDPTAVRKQMLMRNPIITSSVLVRKSAFERFGGFKEMYLAEDYDLWLRMNRHANKIANVPGTHIEYMVRPGSASQKKKMRMAFVVLALVIKNIAFYPNRLVALSKALLRVPLSIMR